MQVVKICPFLWRVPVPEIEPFFMAENVNILYISTDFGHKNSGRHRIIILDGWKTEIAIIIVTDISNHGPRNSPLLCEASNFAIERKKETKKVI